jgi:hypothetical protein
MDIANDFVLLNQKLTRQRLHLKLKTTLFVSFAAVIFFSSLIAIVYFLGFSLLCDKAVESQGEMARTLASAIHSNIEKEVQALKFDANDKFVVEALKNQNLKYQSMGEKEVKRYLMDMDKRWIAAPAEHPILADCLENPLSLRLRNPRSEQEKVVSVIVSDKFGGLAGATYRPSGFYSFEKDWWLDAYDRGHGKNFIGQAEYSEEQNLWCLPFAVPVEDETGYAIGVYKALVNLDVFFKPLAEFSIGKTGNAVLVDDKAYLLYHQKTLPFENKFSEYSEFQNAMQNTEKWGILDSVYLNHGKTLVAYSQVNLVIPGTNWFVFVDRDLREIFAPLNRLIFTMFVIGIFLTIILGLVVFILSGKDHTNSILQVVKDIPAAAPQAKDSEREKLRHLSKEGSDV